ncbi:MAG: PepSY-associated TM helix domain-containing protein [Nitrospiria bacterium]
MKPQKTLPRSRRDRGRILKALATRKFWQNVHLYLGLIMGLPLLIIGLTGGILAFMPQLERWDQPEFYAVQAEGAPLPLLDIVKRVRDEYPNTRLNHMMVFKDEPERSWIIWASEARGDETLGYRLHIDPYTGRIAKDDHTDLGIAEWIEMIHTSLSLGKAGRYIVAVCSIGLIILALAGIYLWWPMRHGTLRRLSGKGAMLSWHNLLGLIFLPLLLITAFTGITQTLGDTIMPFVFSVTLSPEIPQEPKSTVPDEGEAISIVEALKVAQESLPGADITAMSEPGNQDGVYRFYFGHPDDFNQFGWERIYIDRFSGRIVSHFDYRQSLGGIYQAVWWSLHTGELFGFSGRIIWSISVIMIPVFVMTGLFLWLRRRARQRRSWLEWLNLT